MTPQTARISPLSGFQGLPGVTGRVRELAPRTGFLRDALGFSEQGTP